MTLWDRRFSNIESKLDSGQAPSTEFSGELTEFIDWLKCECFPFEWRVDRILKAIRRLEPAPRGYMVIETLAALATTGDRVDETVQILHALVARASEDLRWSHREKDLKAVLQRGLNSARPVTRHLAEQTQEMLLRQGFFEYLEIQDTPA